MPQDWAFRLQRGWGSKLAFSLLGTGLIMYYFLRPVRYKVCSVLSYLQGRSIAISSCQHLFTLRESFSSPITSGFVILLSGIVSSSLIVITSADLVVTRWGLAGRTISGFRFPPESSTVSFLQLNQPGWTEGNLNVLFHTKTQMFVNYLLRHDSEHLFSQLRSQCI